MSVYRKRSLEPIVLPYIFPTNLSFVSLFLFSFFLGFALVAQGLSFPFYANMQYSAVLTQPTNIRKIISQGNRREKTLKQEKQKDTDQSNKRINDSKKSSFCFD